jgi:hypothetical protein
MKYSVCLSGYDNDLKILPKLEELNVGIELQSYGLKGVDSPTAWEEKIKQHKRVIENFKGKISIHGPFVGIRQTHRDYLLKEAGVLGALEYLKTSACPYHHLKFSFCYFPCMLDDNKHRDIVFVMVLPYINFNRKN